MMTLCIGLVSGGAVAQSPWHAQYFPNVELTTHTGAHVRFYDLIKGKTVAIELIYTQCQFVCPLETARLAQVQALLGDRMGRDIFFYSISIDPAHDTPDALKSFARKYHAGPGWTFLTGKSSDIELLSKKLGLYAAPDPDNKDGHMPALLIGNESTGEWIRGSALDNPRMTATMISNWVGVHPTVAATPSYANAKPLHFTSGEYVFSTKCSPCHSLGQGNKIGPDLAGITSVRDRRWLARYVADPNGMLKAGDPIAKTLSTRYKQMQMPNLQLTDRQVADVIAFLGSVRPVRSQ
jgi:protein SCO1/2